MECMACALPSFPIPGMSCISEALMLDMSLWDPDCCPQSGVSANTASTAVARIGLLILIPHDLLTLNQTVGFCNRRGLLMVTGVIPGRPGALFRKRVPATLL